MNTNKFFTDFIKKCVLQDGSLLTNQEELFSMKSLEKTRVFLKDFKPLFDKKNEDANNKNKIAGKKVEKTWSIGDIFNEAVFESDVFQSLKKKDYGENKAQIVGVLIHCNWLMYLCSDRQHKQINNLYKEKVDDYFNVKTEWAIGPTFSGTSLDAMLFIVNLLLKCKPETTIETTIETVITKIVELCNNTNWKENLKWKDGEQKSISSDAIVNIILFLCDSERYLPIPAQNKKRLISDKLKDLVTDEKRKGLPSGMSDIDKDLYAIREQLRSIKLIDEKDKKEKCKYPELNPFWRNDIRPFWDESIENLSSEKLSDETLLEYKKAMVLYGPPGTSKSFQARRIAENMIAKAVRQQGKDIKECIEQLQATLDSHIHILQMHPNYTYDDFIVGKSIENGNVVVKRGKIFEIVDSIIDDKPHFIILDEINRVDISRVFGELFTAMEPAYRGTGIELSMNDANVEQKLKLIVPENLYFIGTMNMIDFSLEQVDFALRRRFLWRLSTYSKDRLEEIISEKVEKKIKDLKVLDHAIWRNRPDNIIECCSALNKVIEWEGNLGEHYLIGHAFFAEIVDIFEKVQDWGKAKNILWQVSILPTLEAYCGTMDADMQKRFISNCQEAFFPANKVDNKADKSTVTQAVEPLISNE